MTDPIADMLTRIRNAVQARHEVVEIPASKLKLAVAALLKEEGFIKDFHTVEYKNQGKILVTLKYRGRNQSCIIGLRRLSKPGRRVYVGYEEIQPVLNGLGVAILSTPKGVLTDRKAKELKVGGELLLSVW
ncbi:MAG TPA: 30S ribosomal protein S8 [Deltaproteobacteria bacterium]|nr:30S ribosomal protein S8 [Deltaproteobacteria bacterium]